jgi:DNA-directed RNA polymerase specialized sigma subunit
MNSQKNSSEIKELILKVRNEDQEAFVELLNRYKPLIESSVYRFSSDEAF